MQIRYFSIIKNDQIKEIVQQMSFQLTSKPRVRKSLTALGKLADNDQRKGYFYCLKLLGVLPPPPGCGFEKWKYVSTPAQFDLDQMIELIRKYPHRRKELEDQYNAKWPDERKYYIPKCLHDILISIHATSCEHYTIYFSYYHRHMMILTQIFLNFAHQILRGGIQKLKQAYPSPKYDWLYKGSNADLWKNASDTYKTFKGIPHEIASHYWQPTNFLQDSDLSIPLELSADLSLKDKKVDGPIDELFFGINKSYPWDMHAPRRWYNKEEQFQVSQLPLPQKQPPIDYTQNQKKLLQGKLDPRQSEQNRRIFLQRFHDIEDPIRSYPFLENYFYKTYDHINYRNYLKSLKDPKNFRSNSITVNESLTSFGAHSKKLKYISNQQKEKYNIPDGFAEFFNRFFPSYQYGLALFNKDLRGFIEDRDGFQLAHGTMHNNFGYFLQDSVFSVTSLVFYPYHSWVDATLQIKLRRATAKDQDYFKTTLNDKFAKIPQSDRNILKDVFGQISSQMQPLSNWKISGDDEIGQDTGGVYPIMEWISPTFRTDKGFIPFSPAFCTRDIVLNKDSTIRTSLNLNQLYRHKEYLQLHADKFAFFKDINKLNYNYNYQIGSNADDINNLLDEKGQVIPRYLAELEKDIKSSQLSLQYSKKVAAQLILARKSLKGEADGTALQDEKLFQKTIVVFATYPSNAKNGSNPVNIQFRNMYKDLAFRLTPQQLENLQVYTSEGFRANQIFIFGKQGLAVTCHKCLEEKGVYLNLDEDFRMAEFKIWKYIHLYSINQTYYDSKNQTLKLNSIYDKLNLVPNPTFNNYRFVEGAEEISIQVESNIRSNEPKFIRFDAQSYSVRTNSMRIAISKKYSEFRKDFDFYKLFDIDNQNERTYFDRYVYKVLRGWVSLGTQRVKFAVNLPSFQRLLRLTLIIEQQGDKLHIKLIDSDFNAKRAFYINYRPEKNS